MKLHHIVAGLLTNCSKNIRLRIVEKYLALIISLLVVRIDWHFNC